MGSWTNDESALQMERDLLRQHRNVLTAFRVACSRLVIQSRMLDSTAAKRDRLQAALDEASRKISHGCIDMSCDSCDGKGADYVG